MTEIEFVRLDGRSSLLRVYSSKEEEEILRKAMRVKDRLERTIGPIKIRIVRDKKI